MVKKLVAYGFTVEIDDFGSGYSSLNTLKSVPAQILKLDMRFLEKADDSEHGGIILESIVRMAKWLGMAVIAEGVETKEQADYLKSIGCHYVQGYLYARPMPPSDYKALAKGHGKEAEMITLETVDNLDNNCFWNPQSVDTLIFNSYVGGACVVEFNRDRLELLRVNDRYISEIGIKFEAGEPFSTLDLYQYMDEDSKAAVAVCIDPRDGGVVGEGAVGFHEGGGHVVALGFCIGRDSVKLVPRIQHRLYLSRIVGAQHVRGDGAAINQSCGAALEGYALEHAVRIGCGLYGVGVHLA